mmetsp:Transcript_2712/g.7960  ORF Transcript_2712/g.7960 Transcript_2712/m.7960 type:complete len:535 (-) Transcript_2712:236-1840(-)
MEVEKMVDVLGCCSLGGSNDADADTDGNASAETCQALQPVVIGQSPQFSTDQALEVLDAAREAWNGGSGEWPQMSLRSRIEAIEDFVRELSKHREAIVTVLMWEIGKNRKDAEAEFDRTMVFIREVIAAIRMPDAAEYNDEWQHVGSTRAFVRRAAIGIIMCLGPYNYPLNETYATLIPALLMGNVVIMKIPTVGGLVHSLTMDAFAKTLPHGTINFISGSGRATMPPLMETGKIDGLAFIGGSKAADELIQKHPQPHRLKVFLQLEAKNPAIFLPDLFGTSEDAALDHAIKEAVSGGLSYNGQRCTALKIMFAPKGSNAELIARRIAEKVESMHIGLPWQTFGDGDKYSQITPLPNLKRVAYMKKLIDDATSKGAKIMNKNGGSIVGGRESTLMIPAVLYPVTPDMDLYKDEQFGPIVPIAEYDSMETVLEYAREGIYGQQASLFTAKGDDSSLLIDRFANVFGKINLNGSCGRSPDSLPFSGRRSSAMGVMSITEALREFSVPTVISYKESNIADTVVQSIEKESSFMESLV